MKDAKRIGFPLCVDSAVYVTENRDRPTLRLEGPGWGLVAPDGFRFVRANGRVMVSCSGVQEEGWADELVGDSVLGVRWFGVAGFGLDPVFDLASGGQVWLMSLTGSDAWSWWVGDHQWSGPLAWSVWEELSGAVLVPEFRLNVPVQDVSVPGGVSFPELEGGFPVEITSARFEDWTLHVDGERFNFFIMGTWRWVRGDGVVVSEFTERFESELGKLVGDSIVGGRWFGPLRPGLDPVFELASGGELRLVSDFGFDSWGMNAFGVGMGGPLEVVLDAGNGL